VLRAQAAGRRKALLLEKAAAVRSLQHLTGGRGRTVGSRTLVRAASSGVPRVRACGRKLSGPTMPRSPVRSECDG
jgi:hypothetical protein